MGKKQNKIDQANMQSDNIEMAGWSEGLMTAGVVTTAKVEMPDMDSGMTYAFGDLQMDLFSEQELREKYPALQQAYEHYQSVLEVCKTKEREDNEN